MKLVQLGKLIKNQPVEGVINIFASTEIKTIKNAEEIQSQDANFVLNIIYRMRSKTFRRKHGKMSRRRRAGQNLPTLSRQTTGELAAMEEGRVPQPLATNPMNILSNSDSDAAFVAMEEGPSYGEGSVAIDVESTPDIEMGLGANAGGKRRRKTRKTRKARKGKKTRKARRG
jgi:hypothetical protein